MRPIIDKVLTAVAVFLVSLWTLVKVVAAWGITYLAWREATRMFPEPVWLPYMVPTLVAAYWFGCIVISTYKAARMDAPVRPTFSTSCTSASAPHWGGLGK